MDSKEIELKEKMDELGMGYFQLQTLVKECRSIIGIETRDGRDEQEKRADAYQAIADLEEVRASFEKAFEAYYSYIFNRDYTFAPNDPRIASLPILYDNRAA